MKGKFLILFISIILLISTISASEFTNAQDTAMKINDTVSGKTPLFVNYTYDQLVSAGFTPQRLGGYDVLFKEVRYDEGNGTFITYINAWNDGNSIHIHNPVKWYMPFTDNKQGAQLQQAYVVMVASYIDTLPYGDPEEDDTLVIYPSIDGSAQEETNTATYTTMRGATGDSATSGSTTTVTAPLLDTGPSSSAFSTLTRGVLSFNTSVLPDDASISSANFSVYVTAKLNDLGSPSYGITGGILASNSSIAAGDYDGFGSARYASDIAYASIGTSARNTWPLNAAGLANISKSFYTVIYMRDSWDLDNSGPIYSKSKSTSITWRPVGYATESERPFLEVIFGATPVAAFTANSTTALPNAPIQLTDQSLWTPTNWDWYWFNNETKSSDSQNPIATFDSVGLYNVRLYVSNAYGGDWENKTNYINVSTTLYGYDRYYAPSNDANANIGFTAGTVDLTWADLVNATPGTLFTNSSGQAYAYLTIGASATTDQYDELRKFYWSANTSNLSGKTVYAANFSVTQYMTNSLGMENPWYLSVGSAYPVNPEILALSDMSRIHHGNCTLPVSSTDWEANYRSDFTFTNMSCVNTTGYTSLWLSFDEEVRMVPRPYWVNSALDQSRVNNTNIELASRPYLDVYWMQGGAAAPVSSFTANVTSGTAPLAVGFTDTSTNTPTSWNWSFKNVTGNNTEIWFAQTQSPSATFGVGNFSIKLNASNSEGYNISAQLTYINVSEFSGTPPVASFTLDHSFMRIPGLITATDTSTNTPTSWEWYWGDGTANTTGTSTPSHRYLKRGRFEVILKATNGAGSDYSAITIVRVTGY